LNKVELNCTFTVLILVQKMTLNFYTSGRKDIKTIYVRIRDSHVDAKVSTGLKVNQKNFKNGAVRINKIVSKDAEKKKKEIEYNSTLIKTQELLDEIAYKITAKYNNRKSYEKINSQWLKNAFKKENDNKLPFSFIEYFDYYLKIRKSAIKHSTYKKLTVFKNRINQYQKDRKTELYIPEINKKLSTDFQLWCDENQYAQNTKIQTLKTIKTICSHAAENGIPVHPELQFITKGLKWQSKDHIHLDFDEIKRIIDVKLDNPDLESARDWLVISCYTALRVSDSLSLKKENLKKINDSYFLQIKQQKTSKPVDIYLDEEVIKILRKRKMNFPPSFSKNKAVNEVIYNRKIKEVCKRAGITKKVSVFKKNPKTKRYEITEVPKYQAVSSHIGRRSFATNYYGIIPTSLLIGQTGHSSEAQFLRYVGKKGNQNALLLAEKMKKLKT